MMRHDYHSVLYFIATRHKRFCTLTGSDLLVSIQLGKTIKIEFVLASMVNRKLIMKCNLIAVLFLNSA